MNTQFKLICLCWCLLLASLCGNAQQLNWAHSTGGPLTDVSSAVYTDNAGNVYIGGRFSGANVDFDPSAAGTFLLSSAGSTDAFVAKYSSTGQFIWAFRFGGSSRDDVNGLVVDQSNNSIYITGYFRGSNVDFDPGAGTTNLTSNGDAGSDPGYGGDIFVAKYSLAGIFQWAFNVGGTDLYDTGIGITTDAAGNVYVGGYFTHTADFNPGAGTAVLNSAVGGSIFIAKYTLAGAYQWAFNLGSGSTNNALFDLATDPQGNVHVTGYYQGTNIDFDPGPGTAFLSSNGNYELFVAKYNTNGQYQFAIDAGGPGSDVGRGIALDNAGNVYVIGDFTGTNIDFDPGPGVANLSSNGQTDVVLAKYSSTGQYQWAFNFGGTPGEFGWRIIVDGSHLFVTGNFSGMADMNPSATVDNLTSAGNYDIFLGKYTLNGEYLCSFSIGGPGDDHGYSVFSPSGNTFYLTGAFPGTNIDFDPGAAAVNLSSAGDVDIYLAKYTWPDNPVPTGTISGNTICTGEQAQLTFNATAGVSPFTIVYNDGVTNITQTNVQSGVPFNITPAPATTRTYTLVSIKDVQRCAETNFGNASTATVTVNNCDIACEGWLNLPSHPSFVTVGDLDVTGNTLTVEALINRTPPLNNGLSPGHLVSKHTDQSNVNYALHLFGCEITTDVTGYTALFSNCTTTTSKTYHIAMVYNGATLKFYRNGFLMAQTPVTGNMINNNLLTKIGQVAGPTNPFDNQTLGYVNEVRFWNVARTQAQIRSNMSASLPDPATQPGLLGYYNFDNLLNKQGNPAFNGILNGGAIINQSNPACAFIIDSCELEPPPPPAFTADFIMPDTVCVNTPVDITNTSTNAASFYWNFCSGSLNSTPTGSNFASPNFSSPVFMDLVHDGANFYVFVVNHTGSLSRMNFGNSLLNTPTITNLGSFGGIIPLQAEGIEIQKDGNNWIGYLIGGQFANSRLIKLSFGASVANTPTVTNLGNIGGLDFPVDFTLIKDGANWYGFTVSADNNTLTRFSFGSSLNNTPVAANLGNIGGLNYPAGIFLLKDVNNYHLFVTNRNNSSISRLDFGASVANTPTGVNLGNPGGNFNLPRDITVIRDCDKTFGFVTNEATNAITRLDFNNNILSVPVTTNLGNVGNLNYPHSISEVFRTGDAVNFFSANVNSNSISRITFNNCTASSIPSFSGQTPPPFQYTQPGVYNVSLFVDEGLPTQSVLCKQIVVKECGRQISGVINDYTEVLGLDPCKNTLTVANASAYNAGDTVLLIQMKGAVVDSSNTAAFGTIIDYKNAGNYEFNYIKSKTGNIIELKNFLTRQYDVPDGVVQLVRVPYYQNAVVSSAITCLPWDGGKGGIVAFNVQDSLRFVDAVDVVGKGFRGGADPVSAPSSSYCYENDFYYPPNPDLASGKGEGIASASVQRSFGKGAWANGGGGGNSHNSGGGGGSNGNTGGFGGYNDEMAPCNTIVPFDNRGIGGRSLLYNNAVNKIFMGGGGGAGHSNNPEGFQAIGGNGAGIVIISANVIASDGIIKAFGKDGAACQGLGPTGCHEGMSGGGAGGTILLNVNTYLTSFVCNTKGGHGNNVTVGGMGRLGPGGGGSGGVTWYKSASLPPNMNIPSSGGSNGTNTEYFNDPWGATSGALGLQIFDLQLPIDNIPFKPNIDSVRIKDSLIGCRSFYFKGFGFTNTWPITGWRWTFGDGDSAFTQNTTHVFAGAGDFSVKLVVTDINGCKDSLSTSFQTTTLNPDFSYHVSTCDPLSVQFTGSGSAALNPFWSFGDASTLAGVLAPAHAYSAEGTYIVKYVLNNGSCSDTATRLINLALITDNIVLTNDTTICPGTTKQLLTIPSSNFCWTPTTYLNDPSSANPITSTPQNITYYYTAEITGNNLVANGNFSQGNTGFTSAYSYTTPVNTSEGQYYVGTNPNAWQGAFSTCTDHTSNNGNMMMVNGPPQNYAVVWSQTVAIQPNTIYAFSAWALRLTTSAPPQMQFAINGIHVESVFQVSNTNCAWQQFYTTWNSGPNTSAVISVLNKNVPGSGNDFALDDISFAPTYIKRDSVKITVASLVVKTSDNATVCPGTPVQLNTTGAASYSWSPTTGLNNAAIPNPVATPLVTTQYIVTGTAANGCVGKDTIDIAVYPKPSITKAIDTAICKNASYQLFATGGLGYTWSPAATLNNATISNPMASPLASTRYYVTITDANTCNHIDSVKVDIRPDPVFTISPPATICENATVQLTAGGGNVYAWQPASSLNNSAISNPTANPVTTTNYSVQITETACNHSTVLSTTINVNPLPPVQATKSNDIDCSNDRSQLNASGAQTYTWSPAASLDNPAISNPVAAPTASTRYIVKGTDAFNCSNYDSVMVDFLSSNTSGYFMPNAFSPNGDGKNDCFGLRFWGIIRELEFSIYNRWGERIFFTKNPTACWDGTYQQKAQDIGVYVYMIKAKTLCGDTFRKGYFTLVR